MECLTVRIPEDKKCKLNARQLINPPGLTRDGTEIADLWLKEAVTQDGSMLASEDGYIPGRLISIKYGECLRGLVVNTHAVSYKG
jgi:hypothetical protein